MAAFSNDEDVFLWFQLCGQYMVILRMRAKSMSGGCFARLFPVERLIHVFYKLVAKLCISVLLHPCSP